MVMNLEQIWENLEVRTVQIVSKIEENGQTE